MKKNLVWMWIAKLLMCCLVFVAGLQISSILLPGTAIWPAWMLVARYTAGCALLGLPLAFLASRMRLNTFLRWVLFAQLAWLLAAAAMGFEAVFFNTAGIVNGLMLAILHLIGLSLPVVLFSGALTVLFRPVPAAQREKVSRVRMMMAQMGA
jgi:hypothetical protein